MRTAAQGAKRVDFERELQYLFKLHEVLDKRVAEATAPALVFQEADLSVRVVRDIFSEHFERAIVDDEQQHHRLVSFFSRTAPELVDRVELHTGKKSLFEEWDVDKVIDGLMSKRVDLPSGGYLLIDYAEALTVIDVNSGSFVGRGKQARLEDTITKTNLEAADEVVKQLRLRDIGGIIVIDFIDMARRANREAVLKTLRKALAEDRTKTFTAEISKLGLVEMTRQNVTEGVREIMSRPCPTCEGEGVIKSEETIAIELERRLREHASKALKRVEAFLVRMHPRVTAQFTGDGARVLRSSRTRPGRCSSSSGPRDCPSTTSRSSRRAPRRSSPCWRSRSARATRSWSRSSSRTCTTSTTRWPRSTGTSCPSRAAAGSSGPRSWSGSTRRGAPRRRPPRSASRWPRRPGRTARRR